MDPTERRQSILVSAKELFARKGYHACGVADIIERAGIARGTFYLYFKSKHDVFSALIGHIIEQLNRGLVAPSFDREDAILACMKENLDRVREFFLSDPDLARILINDATALDADARERLDEVKFQLLEWLTGLIRQAQQRSILRPLDPGLLATIAYGGIRELIETNLVSGRIEMEADRFTTTLLELFMFGLVTPEFQRSARDNLERVR